VGLGEFVSLRREEQMHYIIRIIKREQSYELTGVYKFEDTLEKIGLSGDVDRAIKDSLHEMYQIRNLIVHRGGVIDRHFVGKCPYLNPVLDAQYLVSDKSLGVYYKAVGEYAMVVMHRITTQLLESRRTA